jgi:hypothetical protein
MRPAIHGMQSIVQSIAGGDNWKEVEESSRRLGRGLSSDPLFNTWFQLSILTKREVSE